MKENMEQNKLDESAEMVQEIQDEVNEKLKGVTPDEFTEHESSLFNEIMNTIKLILQDPSVQQTFKSINTKLNNVDVVTELFQIIATTVTHATYQAIAFYDMQLKEIIEDNFKTMGNFINDNSMNINVLKLKVGDIEKKLITSDVQQIIDE